MTATHVPIGTLHQSFVGRQSELAWLRKLLDEADAGEARLALIGGEPGVGKTRLAREFLAVADRKGWQTVWGHCSRDASSPHLPFVTGLIPQFERAGLLSSVEPFAALQGEDVPMVAAGLAEKTVALASRRPLVFVVDDYQFGERSTLHLIGEYVRQVAEVSRRERLRLMLVVTHHPALAGDEFGETLERLRREPLVDARLLTGLAEVEVHELVRHAASSNNCAPQLLGAVVEATRGNPLFVIEVLRHLERQALLRISDGQLQLTRGGTHLPLPPGVTESLVARLKAVDPDVLSVLQAGALLGDTFSLEDVQALAGATPAEDAIDRSIALGLLEPSGTEVTFTHGMVRSAVVESIGPLRRRRLHADVARHLLGRYGSTASWAIPLADHVQGAGTWPDAAQAGAIYARAGDTALDSFAWGTAERFFEAALAIEGYVAGLDESALGWLESRAARASGNNGDRPVSRQRYAEAMAHLKAAGDVEGWGLALLGWWRTFSGEGNDIPDHGEYEEFLAAAGKQVVDVRCQLLTHRAEMLWAYRDDADLEVGAQAFALSRESNDAQTRAYGSVTYGLILNRHLRASEALHLFNLSSREADETRNPRLQGWGRARVAIPMVMLGNLSRAREACEEERELARRGNDLSNGSLNLALFHTCAVLSGEVELAGELRVEGSAYGVRAAYPSASFILGATVAWERLLRGEFDEAMDALDSWERAGGRGISRSLRMLVGARREGMADAGPGPASPPLALARAGVDYSNVGAVAVCAELAEEMDDRGLAARTLQLLHPVVDSGVSFSVTPPLLLPRCLAIAARVSGNLSLAREYAERAEAIANASGARPEMGLAALERAKVSQAVHAPRQDVEAALSRAGAIFRQLDMGASTLRLLETAAHIGVSTHALVPAVDADDAAGVEREVLVSLARGASADALADALLLSPRAIAAHLSRLEKRLGVSDGASARRYLASEVKRQPAAATPEDLTRREREVVELVAQGMTNQQIADELVISLHTAIRHVANILGKTGAANRTEAAMLAGKATSFRIKSDR